MDDVASARSVPSPIPRPADSAARLLHPSGAGAPAVDSSVLREIAAGLAAAVEYVDPAVERSIERIPLLATAAYDAWLVVWGPGAELERHDHDGSIGVVHVIQGELLETAEALGEGGLAHLRRLGHGETTEFAAGEAHALRNPGGITTVSIGVFSPPLGAAG